MKNQEIRSCILSILTLVACIAVVIIIVTGRKEIDASLVQAAIEVCQGGKLPGAADYDGGPGIHPIIFTLLQPVYSETPLEVHLESSYPEKWLPQSVSDLQLVACLTERLFRIESCLYSGGPNVHRMRIDMDVVLRVARTVEEVASFTLPGGEVPECPRRAPVSLYELRGISARTFELISKLEGWITS